MSQQNYKIFINKHALTITNNEQLAHSKDVKIYRDDQLDDVIGKLTSGHDKGSKAIVFVTDKPSALFTKLRKRFKVIKAAGGVVFNEHGELLLIKRLGLWDLPKGKLEEGEDQRLAALREVHEECGLNFLGILKKMANTYHVYFLKGRWILKKTAWYKMIAWGDISVQPQLEEHITEVRWVEQAFLKSPEFETYDSLKELIATIEFPKHKS
jgi:8-oxo-dGTP pyrophosphatase MutT (NUDIX family)